MRATCWHGKRDMRVDDVPEPKILNPRDAIVKITSTAICGSDLHLYNGFIPTLKKGDILGHEFMGEVVDVGRDVHNLTVGDRVVVPFPIACGACLACEAKMYSLCENSNPNAWLAEKMMGHSPAGGLYSTSTRTIVPRLPGLRRNSTIPELGTSASSSDRHAMSSFGRSSVVSASHSTV